MSRSNLKKACACKLKEAHEMLKQGAPLSIIAILRTLLTRFGNLPSINRVKYRFQIQ